MDEIEKFSHHFSMPLVESGFELQKCFSEWKRFKFYVKANYKPAERNAHNVWKGTLQYHRNEYPNLCLLVEIIISLSGSNSSVERAFSTLTNILSDKRMSSKHATLENLLPVKLNDKVWNDVEREEIIESALAIYLKKQRKRHLDQPQQPAPKVPRLEVEDSSSDSSDESSSSTESSSESERLADWHSV